MPLPNSASYISRPLTDLFIQTMQEADGFIADRVAPVVPVAKQFDKYYVIPAGAWNRDQMQKRAPGTETAKVEWTLSDDNYACENYGLKKGINDEDIVNMSGEAVDLESQTVEFLGQQALIKKETLMASKFLAGSIWTGLWSGVVSGENNTSTFRFWSDLSGSDPIGDMKRIRRSFRNRVGIRANTLILTADVWDVLEDHPDIVARIAGGSTPGAPALVTKELVARAFGVDRLLVTEAIVNSGKEGEADSNGLFATKRALLCYVAPRAGRGVATSMATFAWRGMGGEYGNAGAAINKLPWDAKTKSREIESMMYIDMKVVAADLGTYLATVIA